MAEGVDEGTYRRWHREALSVQGINIRVRTKHQAPSYIECQNSGGHDGAGPCIKVSRLARGSLRPTWNWRSATLYHGLARPEQVFQSVPCRTSYVIGFRVAFWKRNLELAFRGGNRRTVVHPKYPHFTLSDTCTSAFHIVASLFFGAVSSR